MSSLSYETDSWTLLDCVQVHDQQRVNLASLNILFHIPNPPLNPRARAEDTRKQAPSKLNPSRTWRTFLLFKALSISPSRQQHPVNRAETFTRVKLFWPSLFLEGTSGFTRVMKTGSMRRVLFLQLWADRRTQTKTFCTNTEARNSFTYSTLDMCTINKFILYLFVHLKLSRNSQFVHFQVMADIKTLKYYTVKKLL